MRQSGELSTIKPVLRDIFHFISHFNDVLMHIYSNIAVYGILSYCYLVLNVFCYTDIDMLELLNKYKIWTMHVHTPENT